MSPMESQMQVQKGLVWVTLLLGAMVFGFFMASETMLLVLAVAGVGWLVTLPNHARLSAVLGVTTFGSALMVPLLPGRPFVWEAAGILGWSGVVVMVVMKRYADDIGVVMRRYRWPLLATLGYVLVLLYLMRTHGLALRVFGGDRMGGRVYLQQVACASFPLVFLMVRFSEVDFVRLFVVHLLMSVTFVVSDAALAVGGGAMWVFYFLDLANDALLFEFGSEATGIRRFQSFAFVSVALMQGLLTWVPLRKAFTLSSMWILPATGLIVGVGLPGGHRGVLLLLGGLLVVCAWAQRVWTPLRLLMVSGLGMLLLLPAYVVAPQLPLAAQRTLAALPGIQLDQLAVDDARTTLEGRATMREVGLKLVPSYLLRGRGFGPSTEPVPFTGHDPWGIITEHVNLGRFYNGPVGLLVNTGIPGTVCLMGLLISGTVVALRTLTYVRRHGAEDAFTRVACVNAAYWVVQVGVFVFLHGDAEFAMNTFGLHLGLVMAFDWSLALRGMKSARLAGASESGSAGATGAAVERPNPFWRRRPGLGAPAPAA